MNFEIIPNLHPVAVHFPIALTAVSFFFFAGARIGGSRSWAVQWASVGHWSLWFAALAAMVSVGLGWQAFNSVDHDDEGHVAMLLHRSWALVTAAGLVVVAALDLWRVRVVQRPGLAVVLATGVLLAAVSVTGWLGGELVYRHGLGVLALPQNDEESDDDHPDAAHPHEHGTGASLGADPSSDVPAEDMQAIRPPTSTKHIHQHDHHHDHN